MALIPERLLPAVLLDMSVYKNSQRSAGCFYIWRKHGIILQKHPLRCS